MEIKGDSQELWQEWAEWGGGAGGEGMMGAAADIY